MAKIKRLSAMQGTTAGPKELRAISLLAKSVAATGNATLQITAKPGGPYSSYHITVDSTEVAMSGDTGSTSVSTGAHWAHCYLNGDLGATLSVTGKVAGQVVFSGHCVIKAGSNGLDADDESFSIPSGASQ